jgi:ParB family chromosome partitioning protein
MIQPVAIDAIHSRPDARAVVLSTVAALAESIAAVGLINPIRVRADGDGFEVIAGRHRVEACRSLGLAEIDAYVVTDDDLHAELAMIDENLCRAELSAAERASQTARRKELYEALHPETKHGGDHRAEQVAKLATRFTAATAEVIGMSERAVRRDAERGEKVIPEVLAMVSGTRLDTGVYLDKLKALPPNEQYAAARRDLSASRSAPTPKAPRPMDDAETEEQWLASIMRVWNRGSKEWRERFLAEIDTATMDRRFA